SLGVLWDSQTAVLSDVNMRFTGSHRDGNWQIGFTEFDARWRNLALDLAGVSVRRPEAALWQFSLPELDLDVANTLLIESEALSPALQATLDELKPKGRLRNIVFDLYRSAAGFEGFNFRAEADALSLESWQGAPGAEGISGYLEIAPRRGLLLLDSERLMLAFPNLYENAFDLQNIKAELNWAFDEDHLALSSGLISAENQGVPIAALLRLDLPLHKAVMSEPQMSLVIGARNADLNSHQRFTPKVLSEGLLDWLGDSIRGGRVNTAGFIYHGSLRAASAEHPAVQLHLDLADIDLAFHPDWPAIKAPRAEVLIDNGLVDAVVEGAAQFDGVAINNVLVAVAPAATGPITLNVSASANPNFAQAQRLFTETPLHDYVGAVFDHWRGEGDAAVDFALQMAFTEEPKIHVNVDADIDFSAVEMADYRLTLNEVLGHLHYETGEGLSSRGLRAKLFGQTIKAQIKQTADKLAIDLRGNVNMADIGRWTGQTVLGFFSGKTAANVHIETGANAGLTVTSDLQGVDILLPQPLYKSAEKKRNIKITLPFGDGLQVMHLNLADQLSLLLGFQDGAAISANLHIGALAQGEAWRDLNPGSLLIGGRLAFADFEQWQRTYARYVEFSANSLSSGDGFTFAAQDLRIDEVMVFDNLLESVQLALRGESDAWLLEVDSPQVKGDIQIPRFESAAEQIYKVTLAYLNLPAASGAEGNSLAEIDPRGLLNVDLDIAKLRLGDEELGRIGFDLRSSDDGAHFYNVRGNLRGIELATVAGSTNLHWLQDSSGVVSSQLQGQFGVGDLGAVLERFGYSRVMETRRGNFDLNLQWPGVPSQWALADSEGEFSFSFKDGRFLKSSDAASGTLRIFSIFNMANIVRRLKFDFRDVFKKGIYFDRMRGGLSLAGGQLQLSTPLDVHGPSSRFQMTGVINLRTEVPDLRLVATLPVGSNLP
ncbi:YhdP family protein, partial [Zhongshania sp.]|uniref:YhdP family phospholipid transporter n=1 Tax=Zhongshania sp. TaxID=1971902 RepID=UPI0035675D33